MNKHSQSPHSIPEIYQIPGLKYGLSWVVFQNVPYSKVSCFHSAGNSRGVFSALIP